MRTALLIVTVLALLALAGVADAQPGPVGPPSLTPSARPTTSPYLSLAPDADLRNPAFQYFRRVRPENEFRRAYTRQGGEIGDLESQLARQRQMLQSPESALGPTGHRTSFMNYQGYFPGAQGISPRGR